MADTVTLPGTGAVILTDEVTDGTLGTGQVQHIKIMDGAVNSTNKMSVDTSGRISALIQGAQASLQTGSITTSTSTVTVSDATGYNLATVGVVGTYAGISAVFEASPDGTNWFTLQGQRTDNGVAETGFTTLTNTTRAWDVPIGGWFQFRVRATARTSGTATILIILQTFATEPIPTVVQGPNSGSGVYWYTLFVPPTTSTLVNVTASATSVTIFASNANAKSRKLFNDSTATLYLADTTSAASTTAYSVQVPAGGYYEWPQPLWTGQVTGIWSAANGTARTTEQS